MSWVAVAIGGSALIGGGLNYFGSRDASRQAASGNQAAIDEQRRQFDTIMGLQAPYNTVGRGALNTLARYYGLPHMTGNAFATPGAPPSGGGPSRPPIVGGRSGFEPLSFSQSNNPIKRALDPLGIFGGGGGFNPGSHPGGGLGPTRFKPSDVVRMLQSGQSIDDIAKLGWLSPNEGSKELNYLLSSGLNADQIAQLQGRKMMSPEEQAAASGMVTPTGPDASVFTTSPDYEFRRGEGTRGIENTFAARGGARSGNALRALSEFSSNLASGEFGNWFNRMASIAGIGQTAANVGSDAALATGRGVGSNLVGIGDARASGVLGRYGAANDALQSGLQNWFTWRALQGGLGG